MSFITNPQLWRMGLYLFTCLIHGYYISFLCDALLDLHTPEVIYRSQRAALHHSHSIHRASLRLRLLAQPALHQQRPVLRLL